MALNAQDVHNVAFHKAPFGRRGYDEEEVDAFLAEVERRLGELQTEVAPESALLSELRQIGQRLSRIEAALDARLTTG